MTWRISKDHTFSASHLLHGLPDDHPCGRLHGHNYRVRAVLHSDTLDDVGFVVDYARLRPLFDWIDQHLDHRHLNDVLIWNPTAERLAWYIGQWASAQLPGLVESVGVSETPKTWAWWTP